MSNLTIPLLKTQLELLLKDELGKFSNRKPAIWTGENYPTGTPTGLACFIKSTPERKCTKEVTGNLKAIEENLVVTLVQFDRKKTCRQAQFLIEMSYSIFSITNVPATEHEYEQSIIRIRNTGFLRKPF